MTPELIAQYVLDNNIEESELLELLDYIKSGELEKYKHYTHIPVSFREFIEHKEFMNAKGILYPKVLDELEELNSGKYVEAVLTGAIGTGKTTIALYTTAYQLYLLSCMVSPHKAYGLDPASEILFIFQSINATLAKSVDYLRFRSMINSSHYFTKHFMFDKGIESELRFPNRIIVKPVSGEETASIGQNVIGGVIDELNFMAVTQNSKSSVDGGTYDQAVSLYNSIARRRKSRFMKMGKTAGILCLVSSKRYPNQFTDVKTAEANAEIQETGKTSIFVYDKKTWEIKPDGDFTNVWFKIYIGNITRKPFIIDENSDMTGIDPDLIEAIPIEYLPEFKKDMGDSLRDIAGVSTLSTLPFITNIEAIDDAFKPEAESIFSTDVCDFLIRKVSLRVDAIAKSNKSFPRFAHVDLGLTSDNAGVVIGHVPEFTIVSQDGKEVAMPRIVIDGSLRVAPPPNGEINFEKIRKIFYMLESKGFPLRWITFDSYQSVDSMQLLRGRGFFTGRQSMDVTTLPYDYAKTAILDGRLDVPPCDKLQMELARLERTHQGKIDHPANFSKDLADSLAGVVYGLTMQSQIWAQFGHTPVGLLTPTTSLESESNKNYSN